MAYARPRVYFIAFAQSNMFNVVVWRWAQHSISLDRLLGTADDNAMRSHGFVMSTKTLGMLRPDGCSMSPVTSKQSTDNDNYDNKQHCESSFK